MQRGILMYNMVRDNNFCFFNFRYNNTHYTDNTQGSPMNFLAYMVKGEAEITSANKTIEVKSGDAFFIPKSLCYKSYWYGNDEIDFISCGYSELNTIEDAKFDLQLISCNKNLAEKIVNIPMDGNDVKCKTLSIFYDVMSDTIPYLTRTTENNDEAMVNKIKQYIKANPHAALSEIADMCNISQPYFYALFKRVTHTTPNDYRRKILCEIGVELLTTTDKKIEEIAAYLKISSGSYFRKLVKEYTGSTPREIRKNRVF